MRGDEEAVPKVSIGLVLRSTCIVGLKSVAQQRDSTTYTVPMPCSCPRHPRHFEV